MDLIAARRSAGFTLVELAIVLVIVGLLIGAVLKGQELIENARVSTTLKQIPAYAAASVTFRNNYRFLAGDLMSPATRIPNCVDECAISGNQNGQLGSLVITAMNAPYSNANGSENRVFWYHLAAARLLGGINPRGNPGSAAATWNIDMPSAKIGGGFHVAQAAIPAVSGGFSGAEGIYLVLRADAGADGDAYVNFPTGAGLMSPLRVSIMDNKLDDGRPQSGDMLGIGASPACSGTSYDVTVLETDCGALIRVQG